MRFPYIPNDDGVLGPFDPDLEVTTKGDVIKKKLQQEIALFFLVSNYRASDYAESEHSMLS